jgi:hypothetical protein
MRRFFGISFMGLVLAASLVGCTGDQEPEDFPGVEDSGAEPSAPSTPAEDSGSTADALPEQAAPINDKTAAPPPAALPAAASAEKAPPAAAPAKVAAEATAGASSKKPSAAAAPHKKLSKRAGTGAAATRGGRVVRYVRAESVAIHGQASEEAPAVGHLAKGDIVMVVEGAGWGKIADNMFVKLSELSAKAVARPVGKEARWQAPKG